MVIQYVEKHGSIAEFFQSTFRSPQSAIIGIILDAVYVSGLVVTSPVWLYKMIRHGRYVRDLGQRFGAVPIRYSLQPSIWVHGVSLGEINAARPLVAQLHSQLPDYRVIVSSTTETGISAAKRLFSPDHQVFRWPLDFSSAVARALNRAKPAMVILMEGEVWPNFLTACSYRKIPVVVVNARMSPDKGYPRYKKLGPLAARLFNGLTAIGAQNESYAEMYRKLGVDNDKIHVTGMMKFDSVDSSDSIAGSGELAAAVGLGENQQLIVAGGPGPGEEKILLELFSKLAKLAQKHQNIRLAVVPRKPERFDEVAHLITAAGYTLVRRSQNPDGISTTAAGSDTIILGDTMGDLRKFYSLASCIFVGRSLVKMGGSDMIEAAAMSKATAFGPHTFNFPQADELARHGCARVADAASLADQLDRWLADPSAAAEAGDKAGQYVKSQQGASVNNVRMICRILGRIPAVMPGDIATEEIRAE